MTRWGINLLDSSCEKSQFDCGYPQLNQFLQKYASQNYQKNYSLTFVATREESNIVLGYYSVSASSIEFINLPDSVKKTLPKYPAPVMLIGQLAVDKTMQGQGLGKILLIHALKKAVKISEEMGIFAVRVDAIDEKSKNFYLKYGFIPLINYPFSLILPIRTIIKSQSKY